MTIEDIIRKIVREEIQDAISKLNLNTEIKNYSLLRASDIAKILDCSTRVAYEIMEYKDFPLIRIGRMKRVQHDAFFHWLETSRYSNGQLKDKK